MTDEETTNEDNGEGKEADTGATLAEKTDAAAERIEAANKERKEILDREEELYAKQKLGGDSTAGEVPEKKKVLTDTEYAEALERGEVNPMKEDGFR